MITDARYELGLERDKEIAQFTVKERSRERQKLRWRLETAATRTKPAYAGYQTLDFGLVRLRGLRFYSLRILFARA